MKKNISILLALTLAFSTLAGCGGSSSGSSAPAPAGGSQAPASGASGEAPANTDLKSYTFKLGFNTNEDSVRGAMAQEFKRVLEEESNGRLTVEIYPAEALGSEQEQIESVKIGAQDFSFPGGGAMSNVDKVFGAISLPFFTKGYDDFHAKADGELGEYWKNVAEQNGYKILSICDLGFAQITNSKRPINTVADMQGLKMRSPNESVLINSMQSLGASVTTLPFTETYMALQQGVVDGQFNPMDAIYQTKFHEVQDYMAMVNIFCYNINFITSTKLWDSLDDEAKQIIQKGADAAKEVSRTYYQQADQEYLDKLTEGFKEITEPDVTPFRAACQPVYDEYAKTVPADFAEKFLKG